jgi:hypothetical protein
MRWLVLGSQVAIALGLFGVWVLRTRTGTRWRGPGALTLREEFVGYGLPAWFAGVIAALEVLLAGMLIAGLWRPALAGPAAVVVAVVMVGALGMRFRVGDPLVKSVPAMVLLVLAAVVAVGAVAGV